MKRKSPANKGAVRPGPYANGPGRYAYTAYRNKRPAPVRAAYTAAERHMIEGHIDRWFGPIGQISPEIAGNGPAIDLCICPPTETRPYYVLCTLGMGANPMNVPLAQAADTPCRAELLMTLPPDWKVFDNNERWYWPLRWLRTFARMPYMQQGWLAYGHTVSVSTDDEPFVPETRQNSVIVLGPQDVSPSAARCLLPDDQIVSFYQLIPLYPEELAFKQAYGVDALLDRMPHVDHIVCPNRLNTCAADLLTPSRAPNPFLC